MSLNTIDTSLDFNADSALDSRNSSIKISVCIIVKNAQSTILECLESLVCFDEIILINNESSDETIALAQKFNAKYGNLQIFNSPFIGFGALKNLAIKKARNDWILSVDSDEVCESSMISAIKHINLDNNTIYSFSRKNLYGGDWIKACGWYPDFVKRLFNRNTTRFNDNRVHESIIVPKDCKEVKLGGYLRHYAYSTISQFIDKMQQYSSLYAEENYHKKSGIFKALNHGSWSFVKNYVFKKGFLYGYKGFIVSLCSGLGSFFKYAKIYEVQHLKPRSCSLIVTTYNQKERLALVLDSIARLEPLPNEVLIADDGSKNDTKMLIESYAANFPCNLRHIWHEDKGFRLSAIRNLAINKAKSEYIIIIDGDMILESNFIKDHLRFAKKGVILQGSRVILDCQTSENILANKNGGGA